MAKRFLESLGDGFDDGLLDEVIPAKTVKKKPVPKRSRTSRRKKAFLEALDEAFESQARSHGKPSPKGKKSFLSSLEDAFGESSLDDLIPSPKTKRPNRKRAPLTKPQSRLVTNLDSQILDKIRGYAGQNGLSVKDIIEEALLIYLNKITE